VFSLFQLCFPCSEPLLAEMSGGRPFGRRTGVEAEWLPVWLLAGIRDMGSTGRSERGAGSVFYDKSSKRWVVMVSMPKASDGKRRRSRRTFRTKSEAMVFLAGGDAARSEPVDVTVGVLLDGWQE